MSVQQGDSSLSMLAWQAILWEGRKAAQLELQLWYRALTTSISNPILELKWTPDHNLLSYFQAPFPEQCTGTPPPSYRILSVLQILGSISPQLSGTHQSQDLNDPMLTRHMSQLLLLGKFEYTGGPIFKVVLECKKRCSEPFLIYIYGIQCDFMPKSCWKHSNFENR